MRRLLAALAAGVLLAGCGLPLEDGVQAPGDVRAEQLDRQGIDILPPGPQPGAAPESVVQGFLNAQISASDQHGIARSFLAPEARASWDDAAAVRVYAPGSRRESPEEDGDEATVRVSYSAVGQVGADGAARVQSPEAVTDTYRLRRDAAGSWQLVEVPAGLTLSTDDRDRAFTPFGVHFLAPLPPPGEDRHLVVDRRLLPTGSGPAELVGAVLAGPGSGLGDSALTAVPAGTALASPVAVDASGAEVTVDLTGQVLALPDASRRALAAQLVWTLRQLPDLVRLRLLAEGEPFSVGGSGDALRLDAFEDYDPQGLDGDDDRTGLAVLAGRVRALGDGRSVPVALQQLTTVRDVAVDVRSGDVAALTGVEGGLLSLVVGPAGGPLTTAGQAGGLRSPTWGNGAYGPWLVRTGSDPALLVVRGGALQQVPVADLPALGDEPVLRLSRDGARLALVGAGGALWVGRVRPATPDGTPSVADLRRLRTSGTLDVGFVDDTELAVLVDDERAPLVRLSVDGASQVGTGLLVAAVEPRTVAALGDAPVLVGTTAGGGGQPTTYSGQLGGAFTSALDGGERPRYPD